MEETELKEVVSSELEIDAAKLEDGTQVDCDSPARVSTSMKLSARLAATGSYLPEKLLKNEDLSQFPAHALPLIAQKTGIRSRRHAEAGQCTSDLAANAAARCIESAGISPGEIDAIVLATSSPDRIQPATATRVQHLIGATRAFAFDVNSVCSGSVYAVHLADVLIRSGSCKNVLVVAAEMYSRYLSKTDFATYPYFGDGAGAALFCDTDEGSGIIRSLLHSDGSGADVIQIPAGGTMLPYAQLKNQNDAFFKMRGKEVFSFAVEKGSEVIHEILAATGMVPADVSYVIPHQANLNIIKEISRRTNIPLERFVVDIEVHGNTAAASVLVALDELWRSGKVASGDRILLVAFGGGLAWGASVMSV